MYNTHAHARTHTILKLGLVQPRDCRTGTDQVKAVSGKQQTKHTKNATASNNQSNKQTNKGNTECPEFSNNDNHTS